MELTAAIVEEWLVKNRDIARKIYLKHDFDTETTNRVSRRPSLILKPDTQPPISTNVYESFFEIAKLLNTCLDVKLIVNYVLKSAASLIRAEKCSVFLLDKEKQELYTIAFNVGEDGQSMGEICVPVGSGIVGKVAKDMEGLNIEDVYKEPLFNPEVDQRTGFKTHSMLCLPIMGTNSDSNPEVLGVACLINKLDENGKSPEKKTCFTNKDIYMFKNLLVLVGIALKNAKLYQETLSMVQENRKLYEKTEIEAKKTRMLLQLAQQLNAEEDTDSLIKSILSLAKSFMNADSNSLFLVDHGKQELYSKVYDGNTEAKISFPIGKGVAGSVAQTGVAANIKDAYQDSRFNPEMDKKNNYHTQSMLVCPIFGPDKRIIGVANLINKIDQETKQVGVFSEEEQELFETFATFCGLALHKAMLFDEIKTQKHRLSIVVELMCFHAQTTEEEAELFLELEKQYFAAPNDLALYTFDPHRFDNADDTLAAITHQMFSIPGYDKAYEIPDLKLIDYILTVRRNYRPIAYHNFTHAVSVTHTLYVMIVNGILDGYMDKLEMFSMLVAALNHDIDHRGTNNAFQQKTGSVLANFYGASTMERHHFNHAMTILNSSSGLNILERLSTTDYKRCLELIEHSILATDLAAFFPARKQIMAIHEEKGFDKTNKHHISLLRGIIMNCADLGAMFKPFDNCVHTANSVYEEFFQQGDKEREMGMPYSSELTDRSKKSEIPRMQVGFYNFVVIPAFECLYRVMGRPVKELYDGVLRNRDEWKKLQESNCRYTYDSVRVSTVRRRSSNHDVHSRREESITELHSSNDSTIHRKMIIEDH